MIKRSNLFNLKMPDFSLRNKSGFFIANKKSSVPMGKRKNSVLSSINEDEILDVVYRFYKK
jgi:hypothetical protein